MHSPTPLHESFCTISQEPPNQGDVLEGLSRIAATSAVSIAHIVSEMHREIVLRPLGLHNDIGKSVWSKGVAGFVYKQVEAVMDLSGAGVATGLRWFNQVTPRQAKLPLSPLLQRMVSIINGVMGDHLVHQLNPMALPMIFHNRYGVPERAEVKGNLVIFVHGLCMDQYSWKIGKPYNMPDAVLDSFPDATVLFLTYNSGRHISQNGNSFAELMESLCEKNEDIQRVQIIGHSMGGLVSRSALFYAKQNNHQWINKVERLICLGSPHHGAVLERLGFMLQHGVGRIPFANALAKLGDMRSAGIIDLRYGSVRDDDWEHLPNRIGEFDDNRKPAPLPTRFTTFFVAGTIQKHFDTPSAITDAIGDYLVSVPSALGEHINPILHLRVADENKAVFYGVNHIELQYNPLVVRHVIECLQQPTEKNPYSSTGVLNNQDRLV